jgi:hypothetical protein
MQEQSRKQIQDVIAANKKAIKEPDPKAALIGNPDLLLLIQKQDRVGIELLISRLKEYQEELLPFVLKIKERVSDITEDTHICAIYLLSCHVFENWKAFFILAQEGKSSVAGSSIRMIKEGIMQIQLFALDYSQGNRTNLDKWLSGEIIPHARGREAIEAKLSKFNPIQDLDGKKLDAHIYQIESQVSHNAYVTILEMVSPFTEDYDLKGPTGYHRALAYLRYAAGSLEAFNIALKIVYSQVIKDDVAWKNLDKILLKHNPAFANGVDPEIFKDFSRKAPREST